MKQMKLVAALLFVLALLPVSAAVAENKLLADDDPFGLSLGAGTYGTTIEPSYRVNPILGLRGSFGQGKYHVAEYSSGDKFDGTVTAKAAAVLADYYPFSGGFHLTAGAVRGGYEASLQANNVIIEGITSDVSVDIRPRAEVNPVFSAGYSGKLYGPVFLSADLGVVLTDGYETTASERRGLFTEQQIQNEIADIRQSGNDLGPLPFATLTLGLHF